MVDKDSAEYIESILRKNQEVWTHYTSGKFDVLSCLEDECKRIILKEKLPNRKLTDTSGYEITKYRVRVSNHGKSKKNDEILLVSYDDSAKILSRAKSFSRTVSHSKFVHREPSVRSSSCSSFESTGEYVCDVAGVAGPGSELIAKLIAGEDEDLIMQCEEVEEEEKSESENAGPDLVGNYYLDSNDNQQNESGEQEENFDEEDEEVSQEQQVPDETYDDTQEPNGDSFDEEYIQHFAPSEYSGSRKTASRQESNVSSRKNDRLTGSVKKALHVFKEYEKASNDSGSKTASKTYTKSSKSSRSSENEHEVEVYTLSPLASPVNTPKPRPAKSETPSSLASSKLTQVSSRNSVSNRFFANTSSTVTPAPPNPFAFGSNSPISQSKYADALTGVTDDRQTPIYAESRASKNSKQSKSSSYRRLNPTVREEDEDERTFTGQSNNSSTVYDFVDGSVKKSKNKKTSSAFSDYSMVGFLFK